MICVSIGRTRHTQTIAEHKHLAEQGIQLVELRLDYIGRAVDLGRLLKDRPCPVVATARRREDGGRWSRSEEERQMLLRSAIAAGVEYVDIEADVAADIPRYGNTKRIISFHDFEQTPDNLEELHAAMAAEDADIVKIATMANSFEDNLRMFDLMQKASVPTIGLCMGEIGMVSRILACRMGAPFSYATFSSDRTLAPGQLNWRQMKELYRSDQLTPQTELYGVVADPVAHSHSPLIHNKAFVAENRDCCYLPLRVPAEELEAFVNAAPALGISGVSVTIPHKERALDLCNQAESAATGIGAINTMIFDDDTRLGYNTDYRAAMDCISAVIPLGDDADKPYKDLDVLVLGAGGVSRAIAWGLKNRGARVTIASRTQARSEALAKELGLKSVAWEERHAQPAKLLVNGTPVGMHPNVDDSPFDFEVDAVDDSMVVFDTVYNPEQTLLIKHARRHGCRTITGVDMFVRQACYQYKLFTGAEPPVGQMRQAIKEATSPVRINR
ncbi:shikimate dehydrogenase [Roseimaritima sediminicola]|uniref:shikimate dehydrogenase n=1 Tax=Roseimaritima sediminicola TaxID=2662066 RepID=UPI0012982C93|nr:shikimate dehydrogenase [Roseimaritima sediminicola]